MEKTPSKGDLGIYLSPASFEKPQYAPPSAWLGHGPFAMWLVRALQPGCLVELGAHNGFSYFSFCQAVKRFGLDTHCFAVDHWQGDEHAGFYGDEVFERVSEHNGQYAAFSNLVRASFDEALERFPDGSIDLLHIDGRHFYEDVRHDFESWRPKLSKRSVVLFHDTNEDARDFGVRRLWAELAAEYPAFEFLHQHGLGVLGYGDQLPVQIATFLTATENASVAGEARQAYECLGAALSSDFKMTEALGRLERMAAKGKEKDATVEVLSRELAEARDKLAARESEMKQLSLEAEEQARQAGMLRSQLREAELKARAGEEAKAEALGRLEHMAAKGKAKDATVEALSRELTEVRDKFAAREIEFEQLSLDVEEQARQAEMLRSQLREAELKARAGEEAKAEAMRKRIEEGIALSNECAANEAAANQRLVAREQQVVALEAELAAIRGSALGRLHSLVVVAENLPRQISLYGGRKLGLLPLNDLEPASTDRADEWTITGEDPHFELVWPGSAPLAPGHYHLGMETPHAALLAPRLYVDSGDGYNEPEAMGLHNLSLAEGRFAAVFTLVNGARRLRLDPTDQPGALRIGRVRLRRLSRAEHYARLAGSALRRRRASGATLVAAGRRAAAILRDSGVKGLAARLRMAGRPHGVDYEKWIERFDVLDDKRVAELRSRLQALAAPPLISVVMPVYNTPETLLAECIDSVRAQIYENWELCIADDCSTQPHIRKMLNDYAAEDSRIKIVFRDQNGHIVRATNSAFELARGDWAALLDHDDILRPHALAETALEIDRHPDAELIYSDEDKIGRDGKRYDPYFKPDFSRELFRSQNYLNHLTVHRAVNIRAVGGWRPGFEGSQDYDLNLRILERIDASNIRHIPKVLYHWRAVEGSTAVAGSEKGYAYSAGFRALEEHVERLGLPARVEAAPGTPFYRLKFSVPDPQPLVSLIIPTRDNAGLLRGCIDSIRGKTDYRNYEIIVVDNGSREDETRAYFAELERNGDARVLEYDKPFNYSAINNFAVERAKGEIVGLVNNDIEVISPDWLTEMASWAVQPDIGCVGAKLYYANDTIQHAGVILGIGGVAGHSHKYFPRGHQGYFSRLMLLQNLSAVTAACLLVRRSIYAEVNGLNENDLTVAFNDVDFCLKVREAGYQNVWTPYAELYHLESVSRGGEDSPDKVRRFHNEVDFMKATWARHLDKDSFYSRNLTRIREDFSLHMDI